ncbi:hypothetical protein [Seonamhaeicola sp.]|uniref:hypothetical protein n=1 Tax=Seonamhaeicola sp. TaxID=1912245 RepID=UPI0026204B8C|nr:hypothetical protein [Seonamhaeicola sp.]
MNYLGEQALALNLYSKEAICWLNIKLKGRRTVTNPTGHTCNETNCNHCKKGNKRKGLDQEFRDLFSDEIISDLICSKPSRLFNINQYLRRQYGSISGKNVADFDKFCKELIVESGYERWFINRKKNYWLAKLLNQHTCTYCNREYIFVFKNSSGGKGMVPQFDHWFAKTDYPLLALSFYNLIPSCATCNTIKSATPFNLNDHLHPYVDKKISSSYNFSYLPINLSTNKIILKTVNTFDRKATNTIRALNLSLIYKGHSEKELQDLIDLRYKYTENYLNILLDKTFNGLRVSKEERFRLIFGIEIEEDKYHKRIMSKFKNDIIKELLTIEK